MRIPLWSVAAFALATTTVTGCSTSGQATGPTECNGQTCKVGEACVVTTAGGGACVMPNDAGVCPNGTHQTSGCCDNTTTTYACAALPASCGGVLACPCAESLCQCGGCAIADAGILTCACLYP